MTEPVPTDYDIIQDDRIDALDDLVTPYYQPPSEAQHSFPVVGQGVSAEMYQQMSLAQGDGILITDDSTYPYRLEGMPGGAAETNSTNRMILKVSQNTGRSEAILRGFYHVLYQDMQIELPPVTTPTTYIIALTYDPRREEEVNGPIRVEVHQNTLPRTHGRKHIVLRTVHREPNQLLTEATLGRGRQNISPTITVVTEADLPDPTDVLYGTIAIVRNRTSGGTVIPGTAQLFESRGTGGWHNLLIGDWNDLTIVFGGWTASWGKWRLRNGGIEVVCRMNHDGTRNNPNRPFALPSTLLKRTIRGLPFWATDPNSKGITITIEDSGFARFSHNYEVNGGWMEANFFIPDYYL